MKRLLTILFILSTFGLKAQKGVEMFYALNQPPSGAPATAFVTTWAIPSNSYTLSLAFASGATYNFTLNWGDGTSTVVTTSGTQSHVYALSGTYTIYIDGTCPKIGWTNTELRTISQWGNIGTVSFNLQTSGLTGITATSSSVFFKNVSGTNLANAFNSTHITTIPSGMLNSASQITSTADMFANCTSLTGIPAGLFDSLTKVTQFDETFLHDAGITSIPAGLFDRDTSAATFINTFNGLKITSIPAGLFNYNTKVTSFSGVFNNITTLASIPTGLFDYNVSVTNFSNCFYHAKITSIPTGLFDHNTLVTNFASTFEGCTSLTTIPSGIFNNNTATTNLTKTFYFCTAYTGAVPTLWLSYPSSTHTQCFYNDLSASNYSSIPTDWK